MKCGCIRHTLILLIVNKKKKKIGEETKLNSCTCPGCVARGIILLKHPVARVTWVAILKEIALGVILRSDIYCNISLKCMWGPKHFDRPL